jgi:hypothetical protein
VFDKNAAQLRVQQRADPVYQRQRRCPAVGTACALLYREAKGMPYDPAVIVHMDSATAGGRSFSSHRNGARSPA